jgi:hypothetical protein
MPRPRIFAAVLVLAFGSILLEGCEQEDLVKPDTNRPPETVLSVAPEMGDRVFHKYRVRWAGLDRDGVVVAYRLVTVPEDELYSGLSNEEDIIQYFLDLDWTVTDATESLFVFRADRPTVRNHSLYVAAIDNEGKVDATPAFTNFMAVDSRVPEVEILISDNINPVPRIPPLVGDTLPAFNLINPNEPVLINFMWSGNDPDGGAIIGWKYKVDSGVDVSLPPDSNSITLRYDPDRPEESDVSIGFHEFRLVAVDDANAESAEEVARFIINYDPDTVIDSVWTFRDSNSDSVPDKLIYPSDSIRVAYHFGGLKFKFHGSDKDGPPPDTFTWNIKGTLITPDTTWFSTRCGDLYCSKTPAGPPHLDTASRLILFVRSRDELGKADGSPDTIAFYVNYPPKIGEIWHEPVGTGSVKFSWECVDPDEDAGWPGDRALIRYRYKIDGGQWTYVAETVDQKFAKYTPTIGDLEQGHHVFTLHAHNADYLDSRADIKTYEFDLQ